MSQRFAESIELLLQQQIICEVSQPQLHRYLSEAEHLSRVQQYLAQIGRQVLTTADQAGFYCGYIRLETSQHKAIVKRQFEQMQRDFQGLVHWLRLVRGIDSDSRPISVGYQLNESELLAAIEESSALSDALDEVMLRLRRDTKSNEAKNKLRALLKYLQEQGYFKSVGNSGAVYLATAKWSLLYDQLQFIAQFSGIELDAAQQARQQELLDGA